MNNCVQLKDIYSKCYGCGVCSKICPKKAIEMVADNKTGFYYPLIDENKCIECGKCIKTCPIGNTSDISKGCTCGIYAVKHIDSKIRSLSSSGGAFSAFAEKVLNQGGIVYGAKYGDDFQIRHVCVNKYTDVAYLRGSKYSQSQFWNEIETIIDLEKDRLCLVVGTPCQVHGIRKLLENLCITRNIIYVDLICHGVCSSKLFLDHIKHIESQYGCNVIKYREHSKLEGWKSYFNRIITDKGEKSLMPCTQGFRKLVTSDICLREACYTCGYSNFYRTGDLTIGDCWGIEVINPKFDDKKGVSLILVNSIKGKELFDSISDCLETVKISRNQIKPSMQRHLYEPSRKNDCVDKFWDEYAKYGYEYIYRLYGKQSSVRIIKRIIKRVIFRVNNPNYHEIVL